MATAGLTLPTMRELIAANAVREAVLVADGKRWSILLRVGMQERPLFKKEGGTKTYGRVESAIAMLRAAGISKMSVDAANYAPEMPQPKLRERAA